MISLIKSGDIKEGALKHWNELLKAFKNYRIGQVVIACTELNAILPYSVTDITFIDSAEALAKATVRKYLTEQGG